MTTRKPIQADGTCTSRFAGCRCDKPAGHAGTHHHSGAAGEFEWGGRRRKRSHDPRKSLRFGEGY